MLRWIPSSSGLCRMGMAVSRKVSKRAVERNRIKRSIRESFRSARTTLPPLDILVVARTSAATTSNALLRDDLGNAWSRLHALKQALPPGTIDG
jgi:ribonuclease P protein component